MSPKRIPELDYRREMFYLRRAGSCQCSRGREVSPGSDQSHPSGTAEAFHGIPYLKTEKNIF